MNIPQNVKDIVQCLHNNGYEAFIVGGCVRDLLLGKTPNDWDITTSATPHQVMGLFMRSIPTGIDHGTVTVLMKGEHYEVTTFRGEGAYSDGRRPDSVRFGVPLQEDLARRDFTINAIAMNPITGETYDPFNGTEDINKRVVRCVGNPLERFAEDGLRVLRAARFCAVLGFSLDPKTEAAIHFNIETFQKVSMERVYAEWQKLLTKAEYPSRGFEIMQRTGILEATCPMFGFEQAKENFMYAMDAIDEQRPDFVLRLASLFHYVRFTPVQVETWMRTFKASNEVRTRVVHLLNCYNPCVNNTPEGWRRWASKVGREHLDDALALYWTRSTGKVVHGIVDSTPLSLSELAINGNDVLSMGIQPKDVGRYLREALDKVLSDPSLNTKEDLTIQRCGFGINQT